MMWARGEGEGLRRATRRAEGGGGRVGFIAGTVTVTEGSFGIHALPAVMVLQLGALVAGPGGTLAGSAGPSLHGLDPLPDRLLQPGARDSSNPPPDWEPLLALAHTRSPSSTPAPARPSQCPSYGETPCVIRTLDLAKSAGPRSGSHLPLPAVRLSTTRFRTNALARSLAASAPAPGAPLSLCSRVTLARRTI